jgi:hypothetical protein
MEERDQNQTAAQAWTELTPVTLKALVHLTIIAFKILFFVVY